MLLPFQAVLAQALQSAKLKRDDEDETIIPAKQETFPKWKQTMYRSWREKPRRKNQPIFTRASQFTKRH